MIEVFNLLFTCMDVICKHIYVDIATIRVGKNQWAN
jgi:hypothetical protein